MGRIPHWLDCVCRLGSPCRYHDISNHHYPLPPLVSGALEQLHPGRFHPRAPRHRRHHNACRDHAKASSRLMAHDCRLQILAITGSRNVPRIETPAAIMNFLSRLLSFLSGETLCRHCGEVLGQYAYATACPKCGKRLQAESASTAKPNGGIRPKNAGEARDGVSQSERREFTATRSDI